MKALLLAAGFGTRLRPLTENTPKCLMPINGVPLLQIWLDRLRMAGVDAFLINTHYLSEKVIDFLRYSKYSDRIALVHEDTLLGTAGTLIANIDFFQGEDGLLIHADNYCLADLHAFMDAHKNRPAYCLMTMMTFQTENPSLCGVVELDQDGVVVKFYEKEKAPPSNLANAAIYILSREILTFLQERFRDAKDFSTEVIPKFIGRIYSYETKETFIDIGTLRTYFLANHKSI